MTKKKVVKVKGKWYHVERDMFGVKDVKPLSASEVTKMKNMKVKVKDVKRQRRRKNIKVARKKVRKVKKRLVGIPDPMKLFKM